MKEIQPSDYQAFVAEIKEKIRQGQLKAMQAVNRELINLYTKIGQMIVEKQEQLGWGKSIVENLSKDLQNEFPGVQGFSSRNFWLMRSFYLEYKDNTKLQPLVAEISWSHNIVLMEKCKDPLEREFYILMTKKYGWSKNVLIHQIEGQAYEHFLLNQTNFDKTLEDKYKHQASLAVKDNYNFGFLELDEQYNERELELGLIKNIRSFLLEMGGDFSFIGNQYKLEVEGDEFFIDLLLYHRRLKSLVAIELKTTDFVPEYAGKMQFYLAVLDDKVKQEDENPSIGIIICKTKRRTVVEYALKNTGSPVGVADYSLSKTLPKNLKGLLPSSEEIIESLSHLID
ncbi:MAG TPA: PDDEXK nuclease domain-containing protein [Chitinophagaceae bacterium]|nr:PDDEXK nuclease domain-containing protein [Chitinophagaceae bacterium]